MGRESGGVVSTNNLKKDTLRRIRYLVQVVYLSYADRVGFVVCVGNRQTCSDCLATETFQRASIAIASAVMDTMLSHALKESPRKAML